MSDDHGNPGTVFGIIKFNFPGNIGHIDRYFLLVIEAPAEVFGRGDVQFSGGCEGAHGHIYRIFIPVIHEGGNIPELGKLHRPDLFPLRVIQCYTALYIFFILDYQPSVLKDFHILHYSLSLGKQNIPVLIFRLFLSGHHKTLIGSIVVGQDIQFVADGFRVCLIFCAGVDQDPFFVGTGLLHPQ